MSSLISALQCLDEQCNDGESNPHVEGKVPSDVIYPKIPLKLLTFRGSMWSHCLDSIDQTCITGLFLLDSFDFSITHIMLILPNQWTWIWRCRVHERKKTVKAEQRERCACVPPTLYYTVGFPLVGISKKIHWVLGHLGGIEWEV